MPIAKVVRPEPSYIKFVLHNAAFRYLWLGQIISQISTNVILFILALVIYRNTGSNAAVSGLFLAYGIPAVLFGMIAGVIVDRIDKRSVLIMANILRAVLVFGLFFVSDHLVLVYIFCFLSAVFTQLYAPSEASTLPKLIPVSQLVSANSLFSFTYYSSLAIGFLIAGPLLRLTGGAQEIVFGLLTIFYLLATWCVSRLPSNPSASGSRSIRQILAYKPAYLVSRMAVGLSDGLQYVAKSPVLFDSLLLLTMTQIILALLGTLGPGFADKVLGIDIRDSSIIIIGPVVLGMVMGAVWIGNRGYRFSSVRLIRWGILGLGSMLMLISLTVWLESVPLWNWLFQKKIILPIEFVLFAILGVANSFLDVPANSTLQSQADGEMRGRVYGVLASAVGGVGMLPVVLGGVLADVFGVGKVIFLLGLSVVLYGLYRMRYSQTAN